ncbi:MAG: MarR family winged helix-turn-helix transcriptional regulator [Longimicrobiales bacterium]
MALERTPFLECADCLCLASRKAARAITRAYERELRPYGLRATQFSLLVMLELKGPQPLGALARALGAERTTLTRNLALIERQSLVETRPGEDARERILAITPSGRRTLQKALPAWRKAQAELTSTIGAPLAQSLRRLARASGS